MKIGIFCSANESIPKEYFELTAELSRWCAREGHSVVYGGCSNGLMGCVAEAFAEGAQGARGVHGLHDVVKGANEGIQAPELIGVVPRLIEAGGKRSARLTKYVPCENLSDRKDLLLEHSDVLVVLPGGIGTLDELFSVVAARTLGYHHKPVILYNMCGSWDSLVGLLDDLGRQGMIRGRWTDYITVATSLGDIAELVGKEKSEN